MRKYVLRFLIIYKRIANAYTRCRRITNPTEREIALTIYGSQKGYPEHLRLVRFFDEEQNREFMFLTNAMELTALQVADLYKNRWQIDYSSSGSSSTSKLRSSGGLLRTLSEY